MSSAERAHDYGVAYLATPYTDFPGGHDVAAAAAVRLAGLLAVAGVQLICPVIQGHAIARRMCLDPRDREFWQGMNQPIMRLCDRIIVGKLPTWDSSIGVAEEIAFFRQARRRIYYCDPATLTMQREGTPLREYSRQLIADPSTPDLPALAHGKGRGEQGGSSS